MRDRLELEVAGMTCEHCVGTVKHALESVPGVKSARVSLPEAKAWVEGSPNLQALLDAVAGEGYQAKVSVGRNA